VTSAVAAPDAEALRRSFAQVARHGDEVPLYFYSYLFLQFPQLRTLFPPSMAAQRDRLFGALGRIVADVDRTDSLVEFLQHLGRDHRKFEVVVDHYPQVGEALLATLEHFLRDSWTDDLARQWEAAYTVVSRVMCDAAAEPTTPPWWEAQVVGHERRAPDIAVVTVAPDREVPYLPGQSVSLQAARRPRLWRYYSPANAPRRDGTLEFHVRAVDGGWVSSALVLSTGVGDAVRLGPAVGALGLDDSRAPLLLVAGGTGLAPLRAMVEELATRPEPRSTQLYLEGNSEIDLYDLPALRQLAQDRPWLTVVPVVRRGSARFCTGRAAEAALQHGRWADHQVYICGGPAMVAETRDLLVGGGVDPAALHWETFGYRPVTPVPDDSGADDGDRDDGGPDDSGPGSAETGRAEAGLAETGRAEAGPRSAVVRPVPVRTESERVPTIGRPTSEQRGPQKVPSRTRSGNRSGGRSWR
jgi:NAD(P)H-flavin reductase/hemoglobin-like flavoprotein